MRIERAATFGAIATVGIVGIALVTIRMIQIVRANTVLGNRPDLATILLVAVSGTAVALIFLFAVIGVFVDRKIASHERTEE